MATVLHSTGKEYFHHNRKLYWTGLLAPDFLKGLILPFLFLYSIHLAHSRSSINICVMNEYRKSNAKLREIIYNLYNFGTINLSFSHLFGCVGEHLIVIRNDWLKQKFSELYTRLANICAFECSEL